MKNWFILLVATTISLALGSVAKAGIVTVEGSMRGDFVFTATAAGEAIFGAPAGVGLAIRTLGSMTFTIDDTGGDTVLFTNAVGQLAGVTPPTPPNFLPFYITPVRFDGGSLTNITRDGMNRIVSGTVVDLAMPWEFIGTGPNDGLVLYGDQATTPLVFDGTFNIDYSSGAPRLELGSTITGDELFNVYLLQNGDRENQIPGTDPLVFIGSNRVISAVPEPSSLLLVVGTTVGLLARRRR